MKKARLLDASMGTAAFGSMQGIGLAAVSPFRASAQDRVDWSKFSPRPQGPFGVNRADGAVTSLAFERYSFTDPELQRQWHLGMLGDLETVWKDYTGKGVSVGIYDSGTQYEHWDLAANYDASRHLVIDGQAIDGFRLRDGVDAHGTAVGGIIAAARNGQGGVGIAYDASITGVDIFDGASPIAVNGGLRFFDAMLQANRFDVVNHSWGSGPGYATQYDRTTPGTFEFRLAESFRYIAETGRDGLGTISVSAAGNNGLDGIGEAPKSDRHQIAVAAYREIDGNATFYSTRGANILVAAPSNDFAEVGGRGTVTTDLLGAIGYNIAADRGGAYDYTDSFGGTSSAAPKVTAVVALMLDANEGLGWRDVHGILAASSRMPVAFETGVTTVAVYFDEDQGGSTPFTVALNNGSFSLTGSQANWNGGRMHFSNDYGFGAIDAYAAVRMAEVWSLFGPAKTSANELQVSSRTVAVDLTSVADLTVRDANDAIGNSFVGTPVRFTFDMQGGIDLEHADMTLNFRSNFEWDWGFQPDSEDVVWSSDSLKIRLTAPDGSSAFVDTTDAGAVFLAETNEQSFTFGFAGFRHVETAGTWTLEFEQLLPAPVDLSPFGLGIINYLNAKTTIKSLKMDLYGAAKSNDDVHHYTDEFFTMLAIEGEGDRRYLSDRDGGEDWVNAAAVTANINLSLAEGVRTTFDGRTAFTIEGGSQIENAVTGDGDDRLPGNALDNKLYGMRGNDWLEGGAGNDTLYGGQGRDVFAFDTTGASGFDRILDWSMGDRIATTKMLRGADQNGLITIGSNALILLDNNARGDTAELTDQGGAVLRAAGRSNGYWWYDFVSDGNEEFVDGRVRELALGQTGRPESAGDIASPGDFASTGSGFGDIGKTFGTQDAAFFLYDVMGDGMAAGVQVYA